MKKDKKIRILGYNIEALQDEVQALRDQINEKQTRILELITQVDYLTLKYEPYRPEGDEDEELTFYGLKEENAFLRKTIRQSAFDEKGMPVKKVKEKRTPRYSGTFSWDFWPPRDWLRFNLYTWNPGRYWQLSIGPLRLDFYAN